MQKLDNKKRINQLSLLLTLTYMISYVTRTNFGAVVSEVSHATGISKSVLSMPLTGSFITYGVGQLISGVLGDRISPKKLVRLGLLITVSMNLLLPLCKEPWLMTAAWCVNGMAQAFMWPPIVRIMASLLHEDDYKEVASQVSCGGNIGTILVYLISPLFIATTGWQGTFFFSAALGAIMLIIWLVKGVDVEHRTHNSQEKQNTDTWKIIFSPLIIAVMIMIVMQGMLRDGITTWMPSFIAESFHLGNEISILTGVLLPIFSILCIQLTNFLYRRYIRNPLACAGVLFGMGTLFSILLYFFSRSNVVLSVLFSAAFIGCIHGVNLLLIGMLPRYFEKRGNVSTMSGILNACTYIGSAVSTYGVAALSEGIGWSNTILLWVLVALLGSVGCAVCIHPWKKSFASDNE